MVDFDSSDTEPRFCYETVCCWLFVFVAYVSFKAIYYVQHLRIISK
jgi:hypothetical protein